MVGDNKESLKGKGVFFGSSVGGWWFVGVWVVGGVWACWIWGGVEACFLPFLRCRLCGVSKGAYGGIGVWLCWVWDGVEACFLPSLSSRLGGVSKGACGGIGVWLCPFDTRSRATQGGLEEGLRWAWD